MYKKLFCQNIFSGFQLFIFSKGFWNGLFTAGVTCYRDDARTWTLSLLNRYEIHSDDRGLDVTWDKNVHDMTFAIGTEIVKFIPEWMVNLSLKTQWEGVRDRPQGFVANFYLAKIF